MAEPLVVFAADLAHRQEDILQISSTKEPPPPAPSCVTRRRASASRAESAPGPMPASIFPGSRRRSGDRPRIRRARRVGPAIHFCGPSRQKRSFAWATRSDASSKTMSATQAPSKTSTSWPSSASCSETWLVLLQVNNSLQLLPHRRQSEGFALRSARSTMVVPGAPSVHAAANLRNDPCNACSIGLPACLPSKIVIKSRDGVKLQRTSPAETVGGRNQC